MTKQFLTIGEVISQPHSFRWDYAIYANIKADLNEEALCLILDPDDVENDENEEPAEACRNGFSYVLSIQDVQSIFENLKDQSRLVTKEMMLLAFRHYLKWDAFIVLGDNEI